MMEKWYELVEVDSLIWQLENVGQYSTSSSLYSIINFRGVQPVFITAVWKLEESQERLVSAKREPGLVLLSELVGC